MRLTKNVLTLLNGTAMLLAWPVAAHAQAAGQEAPVEEAADPRAIEQDIVVTGSRIRGVAPVGSSVIAVGRDDIVSTGAATTADVLKNVPQITSLGFNGEGSLGPAAAGNITRATAPNLRGIGPTATLTVIDGHRVAPAGTQGQLVDPSFLPPLALDRIEVIADGASAIYGSDAVAGVINLIPRKNFRGLEVNARAAFADSYREQQLGAIVGHGWSTGRLIAAFDYARNDELKATDRSFVTDDRRGFGGTNGLATNCAAPGTVRIGTTNYALPGGSGVGILRAGLTPNTTNACDAIRYTWLLPQTDRFSGYAYGEQELGENIKVSMQGIYSRRDFKSVRTNPFLANIAVPAANPFRPADVPATTGVQVSRSFLGDVPISYSTGFSEVYQVSGGLEANIGGFRARLSGSYGKGEDRERRAGLVNNFVLNQALADTNPATSLNLFGGPGSANPQTLARVYTGISQIGGASTLKTVELNVDGVLFDLPGGSVRLAAGGEYRSEGLEGLQLSISGNTGQLLTVKGATSRDVKALYGELFVPLFGEANAMPGVQRLELSLAGRYEEYPTFGDTFNPKIGANWEPIRGLVLRGSYGTSFRAPSLAENDPLSSGAGIYQNAAATTASGATIYTVGLAGGNADLKPETASTYSFGFDIRPELVPGLRLSGTYFNVRYRNQIVDGFARAALYYNNPTAFADFVAFQGSPNFNTLRSLIDNSGFIATPPINYALPNLVLLDNRRVNVGKVDADGIDLDLSYRSGGFIVGATVTRYLNYVTVDGNQAPVDRLNTIAYPSELSGRAYVGWSGSGIQARVSANHTSGYRNTNSTLAPNVDAYTTIDLDLTYEFQSGFGQGLRVGLNVRNLFDQEPPLVDIAGAYDPSKASALGRLVAVSLMKRF